MKVNKCSVATFAIYRFTLENFLIPHACIMAHIQPLTYTHFVLNDVEKSIYSGVRLFLPAAWLSVDHWRFIHLIPNCTFKNKTSDWSTCLGNFFCFESSSWGCGSCSPKFNKYKSFGLCSKKILYIFTSPLKNGL